MKLFYEFVVKFVGKVNWFVEGEKMICLEYVSWIKNDVCEMYIGEI